MSASSATQFPLAANLAERPPAAPFVALLPSALRPEARTRTQQAEYPAMALALQATSPCLPNPCRAAVCSPYSSAFPSNSRRQSGPFASRRPPRVAASLAMSVPVKFHPLQRYSAGNVALSNAPNPPAQTELVQKSTHAAGVPHRSRLPLLLPPRRSSSNFAKHRATVLLSPSALLPEKIVLRPLFAQPLVHSKKSDNLQTVHRRQVRRVPLSVRLLAPPTTQNRCSHHPCSADPERPAPHPSG